MARAAGQERGRCSGRGAARAGAERRRRRAGAALRGRRHFAAREARGGDRAEVGAQRPGVGLMKAETKYREKNGEKLVAGGNGGGTSGVRFALPGTAMSAAGIRWMVWGL